METRALAALYEWVGEANKLPVRRGVTAGAVGTTSSTDPISDRASPGVCGTM